jgi:hypothetical protein
MASTYDIGDVVRISSIFTQSDVSIDPTTVTLALTAPDGTQATYSYAGTTIVKDSTGNYHVDVSPTQHGTYRYRWASTGTAQGAEEGWFQVRLRRVS